MCKSALLQSLPQHATCVTVVKHRLTRIVRSARSRRRTSCATKVPEGAGTATAILMAFDRAAAREGALDTISP